MGSARSFPDNARKAKVPLEPTPPTIVKTGSFLYKIIPLVSMSLLTLAPCTAVPCVGLTPNVYVRVISRSNAVLVSTLNHRIRCTAASSVQAAVGRASNHTKGVIALPNNCRGMARWSSIALVLVLIWHFVCMRAPRCPVSFESVPHHAFVEALFQYLSLIAVCRQSLHTVMG